MARYRLISHSGQVIERQRRDAVSDRLYDLTYAAIRSVAGLDTRWGYQAAQDAISVGRDILDGVPVGYAVTIDVWKPTGLAVTVERIA